MDPKQKGENQSFKHKHQHLLKIKMLKIIFLFILLKHNELSIFLYTSLISTVIIYRAFIVSHVGEV